MASPVRKVEGRPAALMMLDIDHFKAINDTRGHAAGIFDILETRDNRVCDDLSVFQGQLGEAADGLDRQ